MITYQPRKIFMTHYPIEMFHKQTTSECRLRGKSFSVIIWVDYMLRYLEMDVRQLTDVFEQARCISRYDDGLDVAHYITISQLAMSSALKMINKPIGLCPTPEMYRLFEKSIRGGISFTNIHYVETTDDVKIMYIDANNLYGGALRQKLPRGEFIEFYSADSIDWLNIDTEGDYGYELEVDLQYPR